MKKLLILLALAVTAIMTAKAQTANPTQRALWASIATDQSSGAVSLGDFKKASGKVLVSWRMLPGDDEHTGFDLYRKIGPSTETQLNRKIYDYPQSYHQWPVSLFYNRSGRPSEVRRVGKM